MEIGKLSVRLGAGRKSKEDDINPTVGIKLQKEVGDSVETGEVLCRIYLDKDLDLENVDNYFVVE